MVRTNSDGSTDALTHGCTDTGTHAHTPNQNCDNYVSLPRKRAQQKLDFQQGIIMIYIYFKFHKILFGRYLVMANFMDFKSIQGL